MLLQVLGIQNPSELTYELINGLVSASTPEGQRIEYKSELPLAKPAARHEFALDVAAMANAGGGLIFLGIEARNEVPVGITAVSLGLPITTIQQSFTSRVEPLVRATVYEIPDPDGGGSDGVVVLEILASQRRPFAVMDGDRFTFCIRVGRHREHLSEGQLEQMYRDRFRRRTEITESLDYLTERATGMYHDYDLHLTRAYVVATPAEAHERLFRPNHALIVALPQLTAIMHQVPDARFTGKLEPVFGLSKGTIIPQRARSGFKRVEMASDFSGSVMNSQGWIELHDDGAFAGVVPVDAYHRSNPPPSRNREPWALPTMLDVAHEDRILLETFYDEALVGGFLGRLIAYWAIAFTEARISGEIVLRAGISLATHVSSFDPMGTEIPTRLLPVGTEDRQPPRDAYDLTEDIVTESIADLEDLTPGPSLIRTAKVMLDDLFSAFGWGECLQLGDDGSLRRIYFSTETWPAVEQWATQVGVTWTDIRVT